MRTYSLKPKDITRKWYLIDASETSLGRVATTAASLLIGKHKPGQTPHMDSGDYVIIINSEKLIATGGKDSKKIYYRHSGYPGGLHKRTLNEEQKADPTTAIHIAVWGMLPVNKLRKSRLQRLKIYPGAEHQHSAQNPEKMSIRKQGK